MILAVDVGGSKLAGGLLTPDGRLIAADEVPTPVTDDPEVGWEALVGLLDGVLARHRERPSAVGVACGGPMRWPAGAVSPLYLPAWRDFPLRDRLARRYGVPVRLHNDAICVAVGEHWRGAGSGEPNLIGMVVSTGVGGGLILGGRLVDGASGNAGHIGHVVVDPDGPVCGCGARGCLEALARGPAVVRWAREQGWSPAAGPATGPALATAARQGDPVARAAFARAGRALGVAIASAVALCDVRLVVVGGGLAQAGEVLFEPLETALRQQARLAFSRQVRVLPARLGRQAGLVGAGALVAAGDRYWSRD